jgi:hypothetical protein
MFDKKGVKMLFLALYSAVFAVISTACSMGNNQYFTGQDDWENEVLLASECGLDGLRCCADEDPSCKYGQECCVSPLDPERNQCRDDCRCGIEYGYCCIGDEPCQDGLACADGVCLSCGNNGDPCCDGESCAGGLVCHANTCVECGLPGNPCCVEEQVLMERREFDKCRGEDRTDAVRAKCIEGICIYCGSEGKAACPDEPACLPYNLLNNGFCYKCGGLNLPCCAAGEDTAYDCDANAGLSCQLGFCTVEGAKIIE